MPLFRQRSFPFPPAGWLLPLIVAFWLTSAPAFGQDARDDDPSRIRVAAYNLLNFFDVFDNPYTEDEQTRVKPREEIEQIARAIRLLDADVIALSELENEFVIQALVKEFLPDMGYDYIAVSPGNSTRGIALGVMSRRPIVSFTSHRFVPLTLPDDDRQWRYSRDLMEVRIQASADRTLDLFAVHFKSKRGSEGDPESQSWRLAEATYAANLIRQRLAADPDAWIAIAGDFNDTPFSATLGAFTGDQATPDGPLLVDAHASLPTNSRITYLREPYRSTIDFVLVSPAMARALDRESIAMLAEPDLGGSDHAPVAATFRLTD